MIVTSTAPTRLSLFGGGTDLPVYSKIYGGLVISMAINIRQHITFDDSSDVYKYIPGANPDFYKAFFDAFNYHPKSMITSFDANIESGLGSSASAAVAIIGAINKATHFNMSKVDIAERAWDIEVNRLGLYGGKQDQYAAITGGMNEMWFNPDGYVYRREIESHHREYLKDFILLFNSGVTRSSGKIQEKLKDPSGEQLQAMHKIKEIAKTARKAIGVGDMLSVGRLLDEAWQYKKKSNPLIESSNINMIYEEAMLAGATGGKLMGSGGGGFMFFFVEHNARESVIRRLSELGCKYIDYSIDHNGLETRCVL